MGHYNHLNAMNVTLGLKYITLRFTAGFSFMLRYKLLYFLNVMAYGNTRSHSVICHFYSLHKLSQFYPFFRLFLPHFY